MFQRVVCLLFCVLNSVMYWARKYHRLWTNVAIERRTSIQVRSIGIMYPLANTEGDVEGVMAAKGHIPLSVDV